MSEYTYVKYCPLCGAENPRQQAFCLQCFDGDLSTVPVEPRRCGESSTDATATACCVLELLDDPQVRFSVAEKQTIGRTDKADVVLCGVPKLDWISGAHARFFRRGEQWYVQHIGSTNFIKVDGQMYQGNEEVALYDGSVLVLSLTPFRVHLTASA